MVNFIHVKHKGFGSLTPGYIWVEWDNTMINEQLPSSSSKMQASLMAACIGELDWGNRRWWKCISHPNAYGFLSPFVVFARSLGNWTWHSGLGCLFIQHQGCCHHSEDSALIIFVLASQLPGQMVVMLIGREVLWQGEGHVPKLGSKGHWDASIQNNYF